MKTYFKTIARMFKKHLTKMLSISFILVISIGLVSGIGALQATADRSVYDYYQEQNVSDLIVKSNSMTGFSEEEIVILKEMYGEDNIMLGTSFDMETDEEVNRYFFLDLDNLTVNKLELLEGVLPSDETEVLAERATTKLKDYYIGDTITYNDSEYTISGIVKNPLYFQNREEPSFIEDKDLTGIFYFESSPYLPVNDVYISFSDRTKFDNMSDDYEEIISIEKAEIEGKMDDVVVLSLFENIGYVKLFTLMLALGLFVYVLKDDLIGDGLILICIIVLLAAGILTMLVLSTLININISERQKEISTLMVLGYRNNEVSGYIYREIYIMEIVGIIFGLPFGHLCLIGVFDLVEFGSVNSVVGYAYMFTPLFVAIFSALVSLIQRKKIINIDFNEALKEKE